MTSIRRASHRSLLSGYQPDKQSRADDSSSSQGAIVISSRSSGVVVVPRRSSRDRSVIVISSSRSEPSGRKRKAIDGGEAPAKRPRVAEPELSSGSSSPTDQHSSRSDFEAKYQQLSKIGAGGFGSVYAGKRISDSLPVAIKHIRDPSAIKHLQEHTLPTEVELTLKAGGGPDSVGKYASVALLDWYCFEQKLVLVLERPAPCIDLFKYMRYKRRPLAERHVKTLMSQLVEAAVDLQLKGLFHRDLKFGNTLLQTGSSIPRIRLIDFGCSTHHQLGFFTEFSGTLHVAPPEWFKYNKYKAEPTTVWQLGAMMYQMLHATHFDTNNFIEGWLPISRKLSKACQDFLQVCLAKKYRKRATLEELLSHPWLH